MHFYVCSTPYHIFVSLCHITSCNDKGVLYLTTHDENSEKIFLKLKDRLLTNPNIESVIIRKRSRMLDRLMIEKIKDRLEFSKIKVWLEASDYHIYNFCWNPYSLYFISNFLYKKSKKVTFVEDGAMLYAFPQPSNTSLIVKKYLYGIKTDFYKDAKLKKILLQYPEKYPLFLQEKTKHFYLQSLLENSTKEFKENLLAIFVGETEVNIYSDTQNQYVIILTQPLSEDGFVTEEEKYNLYKDIVNQYNREYKIVLKRHPRESTNYQFKDVLELEGSFPSEMLSILNIHFEKAIGICTSAIYNINATEKINIDENFLNRRK